MAQIIAPAGIASSESVGLAHLRLPATPPDASGPLRVVGNAGQLGFWQLRDTRVLWRFNGREIPLNASSVNVTDASKWNSPVTLSGDVIVASLREYDEVLWDQTTRPGVIRDLPKRIELEFPALPAGFYHMVRRLRSFSVAVTVEIMLFDALDPEPLLSEDRRSYYASSGQWKKDSLRLYVNGAPVIENFTYDPVYGYVTFPAPLSFDDQVTATYVWSPTCFLEGEVTPMFKARSIPASDRNIGVKLTLIESRGPAAGVFVAPLQSLQPAGLASGEAVGAANLVQS